MSETHAQRLASVDRLVHEPARLAILDTLEDGGGKADFAYLRAYIGLSGGNLSKHVERLEEAGLVEVEKGFSGKRPKTTVVLTEKGAGALEEYTARVEDFAQRRRSRPDPADGQHRLG